jgi:hypothetical protein
LNTGERVQDDGEATVQVSIDATVTWLSEPPQALLVQNSTSLLLDAAATSSAS